jgi:hypothetical protein
MRHIAFIGVTALLAACGGSNSSNNNNNGGSGGLKTFNYGSPQTPSNAQQNTATRAQTQMSAAVNASVNGQVSSAASLPTLTDSLASSLPAAIVSVPEDAAFGSGQPQEFLAARRGSALSQGCYTISNSTITYNNCSYSGSGYSGTLNGTETVSAATITWNLTVTWTYSGSGISENGTYNWNGQMTITASTIKGLGRSTASGHYSGSGVTYDFQYTTGFDADLTYTSNPFCIASGTLEIRRTLNSSSNSGATPVSDRGAKYTWSGCGAVMIATST